MDTTGTDKDLVTQNIGQFGKFQLSCFLVVQFVGVFAAWQVLVNIGQSCLRVTNWNFVFDV